MKLKINIEEVAAAPEFGIESGFICHLRGAAYFDAPQHYSAPTPALAVARSMAACACDLARNRVMEIEQHRFVDSFWKIGVVETIAADPQPE